MNNPFSRVLMTALIAFILFTTPVMMFTNPLEQNNILPGKNILAIPSYSQEDEDDDEDEKDKDDDNDNDNDNNNDNDTDQQQQQAIQPPLQVIDNVSKVQHEKMLDQLAKIVDTSVIPPVPPIECNCTEPTPGNGSTSNMTNQVLIQPYDEMILSNSSSGELTNPEYANFYTVSKLFDNNTKKYSAWSQFGDTAAFDLELKEALKQPICAIELYSYQPKDTPFVLELNTKSITGTLNAPVIPINTGCVEDLKTIGMEFDSARKFVSMTELKLFENKTEGPPPPPVEVCNDGKDNDGDGQIDENCPPGPGPGPVPGNNSQIDIVNSNATINLINSTITFTFDNATLIDIPWYNYTDDDEEEDEEPPAANITIGGGENK